MSVLPVPKTNCSGPHFYKFTQDNGKTRKTAKQAVTATLMSCGTINIPAWKVMKSCLLRRDQMRLLKTTPLLCFTVISWIKSPWCLLYLYHKRKKEGISCKQRLQHILTTVLFGHAGGTARLEQEKALRGILRQLQIQKMSGWEEGLPERY